MPKPSPQPKSIRTACQHPQETTFTACNASTTQKDACFPAKKLYRRGERKHYLFLGKLEKSGETKKGWHCSNATPFPQADAG
jgi:hypothetical protein